MLLNQSQWRTDPEDMNKQTNVRGDECEVNSHNQYNKSQANYTMLNFSENGSQLGNFVKNDSKIRNGTLGNILTQGKSKVDKILTCRPYITTPFMGAGQASSEETDIQSKLIMGVYSTSRKSCNELSGISIDRFIPLLPAIKKEVQNPNNIIESGWVRGGMHTRMTVRNMDYIKSCNSL